MLYCVGRPTGLGGCIGLEFIFAEDVEVIDAPAGLVVEALLDLVGTHDPSLADLFTRWYTAEDEQEG